MGTICCEPPCFYRRNLPIRRQLGRYFSKGSVSASLLTNLPLIRDSVLRDQITHTKSRNLVKPVISQSRKASTRKNTTWCEMSLLRPPASRPFHARARPFLHLFTSERVTVDHVRNCSVEPHDIAEQETTYPRASCSPLHLANQGQYSTLQ